MTFLDPQGLVDDFSHKMGRSADMELEAAALERLAANFEGVPGVRVPRPLAASRGALVESLETGAIIG